MEDNNEPIFDLFTLVFLNNKHRNVYHDKGKKQTRHVLIEKIKIAKSFHHNSIFPYERITQDFTMSYSAWRELKEIYEETNELVDEGGS